MAKERSADEVRTVRNEWDKHNKIIDARTKLRAALGVDANGKYSVLSNDKDWNDNFSKSSARNNFKNIVDNVALKDVDIKTAAQAIANKRDQFIINRFDSLSKNTSEAYQAFKEKAGKINGNFNEDFKGKQFKVLEDFRALSKELDDKQLGKDELQERYKTIIQKHHNKDNGQLSPETNYLELGDKLNEIAKSEEYGKFRSALEEQNKYGKAAGYVAQRRNAYKPEELKSSTMLSDNMNFKVSNRSENPEKHYRRDIDYKKLRMTDDEARMYRESMRDSLSNASSKTKGFLSRHGGKVAAAVTGLLAGAGIIGSIFASGGRQPNSNLYNANQSMY